MSTPVKISVVLFLTVGAFVAGNLTKRRPPEQASSTSPKKILYWSCPMHAEYKSDHPGDCPSCGMRLVPAYSGGENQADAAIASPAGTVQVNAARQQLIGVRTEVVQRVSTSNALRVPGRIAVDDARLYRLVAATDGWVRELGENPAGTSVRKDAILASYYVRDLLAAQQNYLYRFDTNAQLEQSQPPAAIQRTSAALSLKTALDVLLGLGMTDLQIQELLRTHETGNDVRLYSPATGFVLARNISPGQRFDKGSELYRIADISHIWVLTDVFEKDREFLKPGAQATVRYRGREFPARMSDSLPQLDPQSRTLKTRFALDNPGFVLRPDMFVDVEIHVNMPEATTAPADAIIDSGLRRTVYVDHGDGMFEPRLVQTGWRFGDRIEITGGLEPGERIVTEGSFLIDSESRMRKTPASAPAAAKAAAGTDPVCGMDVDPNAPNAIKIQRGGQTYVFCSEKCKRDFESAPARYEAKKHVASGSSGGRS